MGRIPKLRKHTQGFYTVRYTGQDGKKHDLNFGWDKRAAEFQYSTIVSELAQSRNNPQSTQLTHHTRPALTVYIDERCVS